MKTSRLTMARLGLPSLSLLLLLACAGARAGLLVDDTASWKEEEELALPAAPQQESLYPFYVSPLATLESAVDGKSVSVGADGVVRYTLVVTSRSGARNVSYEGIRCATGERKLYAFGQKDGSWSRAKRSAWEPIQGSGANRQQAALFTEYFCDTSAVAGKAEDMVYRLRHKQPLR